VQENISESLDLSKKGRHLSDPEEGARVLMLACTGERISHGLRLEISEARRAGSPKRNLSH